MGNTNLACVPNDFIECEIVYGLCALCCVLSAAVAAGCTMGLMSLDIMKLRIKLAVGTVEEKSAVTRVLPLVSNHHLLLCTLLLFNALANEALPIFLNGVVNSWAAILISVTLVLLFGEIIPTAFFTGPNQLIIASRFAGVVYVLQLIFYPIAWPMAAGLDYFLGCDDEEMYNRDELSAMLTFHSKAGDNDEDDPSHRLLNDIGTYAASGGLVDDSSNDEAPLSRNEMKVITGVISLATKTISDVLIPLDKVDCLSSQQILDHTTIEAIENVGHSRLPVFFETDRKHIIGFFLVKKLISVNPERSTPLSDLPLNRPIVVGLGQSLLDVLRLFQQGHSHIALISAHPSRLDDYLRRREKPSPDCEPLGIVTIEDIFEQMLQSQIYDEDDIEKGRVEGGYDEASTQLRELSMSIRDTRSYGGNGGLQGADQPAHIQALLDVSSASATFKPVSISGKYADAAVDSRLMETLLERKSGESDSYNTRHVSIVGRHSEGSINLGAAEYRKKLLAMNDSLTAGVGASNTRITPSILAKYLRGKNSGGNVGAAAQHNNKAKSISGSKSIESSGVASKNRSKSSNHA